MLADKLKARELLRPVTIAHRHALLLVKDFETSITCAVCSCDMGILLVYSTATTADLDGDSLIFIYQEHAIEVGRPCCPCVLNNKPTNIVLVSFYSHRQPIIAEPSWSVCRVKFCGFLRYIRGQIYEGMLKNILHFKKKWVPEINAVCICFLSMNLEGFVKKKLNEIWYRFGLYHW